MKTEVFGWILTRNSKGTPVVNKLIAKYLFYLPIQLIRGQNLLKHIPIVAKNESMSLDEIIKIRESKFKALIATAYNNVPHYKDLFNTLNLEPSDIKSTKDLQKIPILSKHEILKKKSKLINPNYAKKVLKRKTGGSTGMTLHFQKGAEALASNDAVMFRCYKWYNIEIGDRQVRFWGVPVTDKLRRKEELKDFLTNRIRISAFDISDKSCLDQYKRIKRFRPSYFYGYTTAIYGFCLFMKKNNININDLDLKAVICTAEKMYPHHQELFKEVFDCPIVDEYGSSENGIIAFQCKEGNMHLMADQLYTEFIDEDGNPAKPGQPGRIVITDLSCHAMPLIRYDIGDIGKPSNKICDCGIQLPLMEIVEGRKEDFIRKKNGELIHAAYLCYTLKEDTVHEFKMYQKRLDLLHVQIVKSPSYTEKSEDILASNLRSALGNEVRIDFEYLDTIPREKSGKLRYFVSEIDT